MSRIVTSESVLKTTLTDPSTNGCRTLYLAAGGTAKATTRYRTQQYLAPLRERGFHVDQLDPLEAGRRSWESLPQYDVVVVQKRLPSRLDIARIRKRARKLVYEFDDAVMFRSSRHAGWRDETWWSRWRQYSMTRQARFRAICAAADVVIAGSGHLLDHARQWSRRSVLIPTAVDLSHYPSPRVHGDETSVRLVWIGGRSSLGYLLRLGSVLEHIDRNGPDVSLRVICKTEESREALGAFDFRGHLRVEHVEWHPETEVDELCSSDIGLAPLSDDSWARGKCGCKVLQYFAAGLPVLCSPVGANAVLVRDGVSGYHVRSDGEWSARLGQLTHDPARRQAMGMAGREAVRQRYSVEAQLPILTNLLRSLTA